MYFFPTCLSPQMDRRHITNCLSVISIFLILIPNIAFAQQDKEDRDPEKKVTICHKGTTIRVSRSALDTHLEHGDYMGPCVEAGEGIVAPLYTPPETEVGQIGPELTSLQEKFEEYGSVPSDDIYMVSEDRVLIEIVAESSDDVQTILDLLSEYGEDVTIYDDFRDNSDLVITVLFPMGKLEELNNDPEGIISFVRPVYTPILKGGIITSQGDKAIHSDRVRSGYELVDGAGVKICVMSDSYNAKEKAQADIDNGDLPVVEISEDYSSDFGSHYYVVDEGRAMCQIIHDVAPGADLAFRTGFNSVEHMAEGIHILSSIGCQIIVDDITHLTEPFFQDGLISKAVDAVTTINDVMYFSSAGNFGNFGYESQFNPDEVNPSFHNFGAEGIDQIVVFEKAGVYIIVLQWDDDYQSLGGIGNLGAQNDLDISLIDDAGNTLVSLKTNNLGGDPIEIMPVKVTGDNILANLMIERVAGNEDVDFKYIVFVGGLYFDIPNSLNGAPTIVGQANASGAYAVGAAYYNETPEFGTDPPLIM